MKKHAKLLSLIMSLAMAFSLLAATVVSAEDGIMTIATELSEEIEQLDNGEHVLNDALDDSTASSLPTVYIGSFGTTAAMPRYAHFINTDVTGAKDAKTITETHTDGLKSGDEVPAGIVDTVSWHNGLIYSDGKGHTVDSFYIEMDTDADGTTTNDFSGLGAAIIASGKGTKVTITDSTIETTGVAKLALFTDEGGVSIVKNSTLKANGGQLYKDYRTTADQNMMVSPPWVLGLGGTQDAPVNARTTNIMGNYSVGIYIDSYFYAAGWGALSTDSGSDMHMVVINCDIKVENSGYGAYDIGEAVEDYYGVRETVSNCAIVMCGGYATFQSYNVKKTTTDGVYVSDQIEVIQYDGVEHDDLGMATSGTTLGTFVSDTAKEEAEEKGIDNYSIKSEITSANFGFMCHANGSSGWNVVKLLDGTTVTTTTNEEITNGLYSKGDAIFLVKKINADLLIDGATVNPGNGVVLQIIDNDDDYIGLDVSAKWGFDDGFGHSKGSHMPTFNTAFSEKPGYSYLWDTNTNGPGWDVNLTIKNTTMNGVKMWNSTGYVGTNPSSTMNITIGEKATVTAQISAGAFSHYLKDCESVKKELDLKNQDYSAAAVLGHVENVVNSNGDNIVNVSVVDGGTWNVTGKGIIDSLVVDENSSVYIGKNSSLKIGDKEYRDCILTNGTYPTPDAFTDVDSSNGFKTEIEWAAAKGITEGYSDGTFRPWNSCSRIAYVVFLWRLAGAPDADASSLKYTDVSGLTEEFKQALAWATANGVATGWSDGKFKPNDSITRSASIILMWRALGKPAYGSGKITFTDVTAAAGTDQYNAILWAQNAGISSGWTLDGTGTIFKPYSDVNRAAMIAFIYRVDKAGYSFGSDENVEDPGVGPAL